MVIALMVGWKWLFRIPLIIFWAIAIPLSFTPYGFLTQMCNEHVTTSITLIFLTVYFLGYPLMSPFFPKIKNDGGEIMERRTALLFLLAALLIAVVIVSAAAPGAIGETMENSVLAPLYGGVMGLIAMIDGYAGSQMLVTGIAGGVILAAVVHLVIRPKIAAIRAKSAPTPSYNTQPSYVPPTQVQSTPAPIPRQQETNSE